MHEQRGRAERILLVREQHSNAGSQEASFISSGPPVSGAAPQSGNRLCCVGRSGVLDSTITSHNGEETRMMIDHELCRARTETQYCRSCSFATPNTAPSRPSS